MKGKEWLELITGVVLVAVVAYCLSITLKQKEMIQALNEGDKIQIQQLIYQNDELASSNLELLEALTGLQDANGKLEERVDNLEKMDPIKVEPEEPTPADLTNVENRINLILTQIEELEKEKVTEQDFEKWAEKLKTVVNNSLIELSKPSNVEPVKPMPNVTNVVEKVALSNAEKTAIARQAKMEVFKQFEQAGYGKFVDGKFVLDRPFKGAVIAPGTEDEYLPITPYK